MIAIVAGIGWILFASLVVATLSGIFQTALYRYSAGLPTGAFDGDLDSAFAQESGAGLARRKRHESRRNDLRGLAGLDG